MTAVIAGALLALATVTAVLLLRRPTHPVTWVLVVDTAVAFGFLLDPQGFHWLVWILMWVPLLLVFPDGLRTSRWRQVWFWYVVGFVTVGTGLDVLSRMHESRGFLWVATIGAASCLAIAVGAVVALARTRARSRGLRRSRVGLVLIAAMLLTVFVLAMVVSPLLIPSVQASEEVIDVMDQLLAAAVVVPPVAVGLSMLLEPPGARMRWADRVWPWLLAIAAGLLLGGSVWQSATVLGLVRLPDERERWAGIVAAVSAVMTASVVLLISRIRSRLPVAEDRASIGLRQLADRLGETPRPEDVLPLVARTVGSTLDLRGSAVDVLTSEGRLRLAAWGDLDEGRSVVRPLRHAGVEVGSLVLVPHHDGVSVDVTALDGILPSVAAVVAATRLTRDLAAARDRVVRVREEERARLRADLHDELSPSLAGTRLTIAAAGDRLHTDPAASGLLLAQADSELGHAADVVRNILDDLRPDSLTHQDLLTAIETRAAGFDRPGEFSVVVQADAPLPGLAPAVETAVFRIVSEALSNAARHSRGSGAVLRLARQGDELHVAVTDDGIGLPARRREGVGLGSMADRADAAGGRLQVSSREAGGTAVEGWFPVSERLEP